MKKKIEFLCFFVITMLMVLPVASAYSLVAEQQPLMSSGVETQDSNVQEEPVPAEITGYLLIHVSVYTPGEGLHPYMGANISVKGFFFSYSGKTDEQGDCLFQVHTHLLRVKRYFIKVSIPPEDWLHTKINSLFIQRGQIVYRDFLFIVL
jgi:hypothetical protein